MSEEFEQAHEHLEHAAHGHEGKSHTRPAVIIAIMAAALALTEFAAKDAQTNYLTNHIAATDTWAQYEAKAVRRTVLTSEADLLQSLPGSNDAAIQKRIAEDRKSGIMSGVNGTPTFFVNGRRHDGPPDAESLLAALQE